jgi:hypothetical protein
LVLSIEAARMQRGTGLYALGSFSGRKLSAQA